MKIGRGVKLFNFTDIMLWIPDVFNVAVILWRAVLLKKKDPDKHQDFQTDSSDLIASDNVSSQSAVLSESLRTSTMTNLPSDQLQENLQIQLNELESLQSVFYNPGEIKIDDIYTLEDIKHYVDNKLETSPPYLDFVINLVVGNSKFEVCVTLPHEYPNVEPEVFVRNHKLNRKDHVQLNKVLGEFIATQEKGEPCIFSAILWLQDNAHQYVQQQEETPKKKEIRDEKFVRYWIYSHHIYSKTKRREIVDLAQQLNIHGFCMPGKPGIICVEGAFTDVTDWWQSIKSMNWKKIFCKVEEEDNNQEGSAFLKFQNFEEVTFQNSGVKCNHMDMGELFRYLEEHSLGYIFKDLFGVEAKSNNS